MKGLLAGLPAADPLDLECVFTINPPLCLQWLHPVLPTSLLHHSFPHIQTVTFTGASHQPHHPSTPYFPKKKTLLHLSTSPAHIPYVIVHACNTLHLQVNTDMVYTQMHKHVYRFECMYNIYAQTLMGRYCQLNMNYNP